MSTTYVCIYAFILYGAYSHHSTHGADFFECLICVHSSQRPIRNDTCPKVVIGHPRTPRDGLHGVLPFHSVRAYMFGYISQTTLTNIHTPLPENAHPTRSTTTITTTTTFACFGFRFFHSRVAEKNPVSPRTRDFSQYTNLCIRQHSSFFCHRVSARSQGGVVSGPRSVHYVALYTLTNSSVWSGGKTIPLCTLPCTLCTRRDGFWGGVVKWYPHSNVPVLAQPSTETHRKHVHARTFFRSTRALMQCDTMVRCYAARVTLCGRMNARNRRARVFLGSFIHARKNRFVFN